MLDSAAELSLAAAFTLGLLGNVHCLAMCGGIVTAFSTTPRAGGRGTRIAHANPLPYNLGRISSYVLAGAAAGSFGVLLADLLGTSGTRLLRGLFGVMMVAAGLYIAGWSRGVAALEGFTRPLWRRLSKGVAKLRPADRTWKAVALGAIWGWLPCGLVYSALMGAVASGSGTRGALVMLCFGAGTLPGLLAAGALAGGLGRLLGRGPVRALAGMMVLAIGLWTLAAAAVSPGLGTHAHRIGGTPPAAHAAPPAEATTP